MVGLLLAWGATGCATLGGNHQIVSVDLPRGVNRSIQPLDSLVSELRLTTAPTRHTPGTVMAKDDCPRANTTLELEGCRTAIGHFAAVKELAAFPEVDAWAEANKNLETCRSLTK